MNYILPSINLIQVGIRKLMNQMYVHIIKNVQLTGILDVLKQNVTKQIKMLPYISVKINTRVIKVKKIKKK